MIYNPEYHYITQDLRGGFIFSKSLKKITDTKYKHGKKEFNFIRKDTMPLNKTLHLIISNAYNEIADESINDLNGNGWDIIKPYTDTIKPYLNEKTKTIVLGIRGTADFKDVIADLNIITNNLKGSKRFNNDLDFIKKLQKIYNPNEYTYYAVGHSLGGAIVDELLNQNLIKQGISYNPAVEDKYLNNKNHLRIYNEGDILYNLMGKYSSNQEVRKNVKSFFQRLLGLTELTKMGQGIYYHLLNNFKGGLLLGGMLKDTLGDLIYGSGNKKTYKQMFNEKYGFKKNESHSLKEISDITGYDLKGLEIIQDKGEGAYYSNPQSVRPHIKSATEWGIARVYSAVMGGKTAKIDKDHLIKK